MPHPRDASGELIEDKALSGGRLCSTPAFVVTTSNITPDVETGIGSWSDAEIVRAVTQEIGRDGHTLKPPMAFSYYAGLRPSDLADIIAHLRTVPPLQ